MPELPEVEVVRRGLEQYVQGRTLVGPEVLHPRAARHNTTPRDVEKRLDGAVVQAVERRVPSRALDGDAGHQRPLLVTELEGQHLVVLQVLVIEVGRAGEVVEALDAVEVTDLEAEDDLRDQRLLLCGGLWCGRCGGVGLVLAAAS